MGKDAPWIVGVALAMGVALSIAAYALGSGTTSVTLLAVALIALAAGQLLQMLRGYSQSTDVQRVANNQSNASAIVHGLAQEANRLALAQANLADGLAMQRAETQSLNSSLQEGMGELRKSHELVAQNLKSILDAQHTIQDSLKRGPATPPVTPSKTQFAIDAAIEREQQWLAQVTGQEGAAEQDQDMPIPAVEPEQSFDNSEFAEALNLALEPIVDLYTSNTAHYRMVLGMTNPQGEDIAQDVFLHHADRIGMRGKLDVHVIEQALILLVQLRQRDPNLCIFVPAGATTLASPAAINNVLTALAARPEVAQGIVLDLHHASLASLSDASLEGLATLARAGVVLSLSQASIAGIDLASLNRLNVRFVGLAASSVGVGFQISAGLAGFVQSARALRIQVVISNIGDPRHVSGLARTARFASGPAFAPPRRLKRNIPQPQNYSAAA